MSTNDSSAPGATAPSAALSTSADARKALESAITAAIVWRDGGGIAAKVDAFAAAVRAEALAPWKQNAREMMRVDTIDRAREDRKDALIADLRAAIEASREDVRRLLAAKGVET